jgi:hypothetical protein
MNAVTIEISADKRKIVAQIAAERGMSVENLFESMTDTLISQFEVQNEFHRLAEQGRSEIETALQLLKRT